MSAKAILSGVTVAAVSLVLASVTPTLPADGAKLFAEKCAMCHGAKGEGTPTGPVQKGNPFITKGKPGDIKQVILEGRAGSAKKYSNIPIDMPKGLVSDAEADALVTFLQGDLQR